MAADKHLPVLAGAGSGGFPRLGEQHSCGRTHLDWVAQRRSRPVHVQSIHLAGL